MLLLERLQVELLTVNELRCALEAHRPALSCGLVARCVTLLVLVSLPGFLLCLAGRGHTTLIILLQFWILWIGSHALLPLPLTVLSELVLLQR